MRLKTASPLKGWAIKVARRGAERQTQGKEAASLLIGALATFAQYSGVKTLNLTSPSGQSLALAIIENARFGEKHGETTLSPVIDGE